MMIGVIILVVCFFLLALMLLEHKKMELNHSEEEEKYNLQNITVIIPFKNEEHKIRGLLEDIHRQNDQPKKFIFVDDHSTDESYAIVKKWCEQHKNANVYQLENGIYGKKNALRRGIYITTTDYFLSLDADVRLSRRYFENLQRIAVSSLVVLPVLMIASNWKSRMFSLEYHFFNAFNYLVSPWFTLSASGANLLVNKTDFLNVDSIEKHQKIASGDDYFLLRDFQKAGLSHKVLINFEVAVYTKSVQDYPLYFNQRSRWLKKTQSTKYKEELLLGILILVYFLVTFSFILYALISGQFLFGLVPVFIQTILAFHILQLYQLPKNESPTIWELFLFHIYYPVILLYILIKSTFDKEKWEK